MQALSRTPRTQQERSERTRHRLLAVGRAIFVREGYAGASTPRIVGAAGITRGALYHHFADKRALFQAVVEREASAVSEAIAAATPPGLDPRRALLAGGRAYFEAMAVEGRTRLLLVEGPAVLGREVLQALDERYGARSLQEGLRAALPRDRRASAEALALLLSAAYDRAALAIADGAPPGPIQRAMETLVARAIGP